MRIVLALAAFSVGVAAQPRVGLARQPVVRQAAMPQAVMPAVRQAAPQMVRQAAPQMVRQVALAAPQEVRQVVLQQPVRLAGGRGDDWTAWNDVYRSMVSSSDASEAAHPQHQNPGAWFKGAGAVATNPGAEYSSNYVDYGRAMAAGGLQVRLDLDRDKQARLDDTGSYEYKILDNSIAKNEAKRFNAVLTLLDKDSSGGAKIYNNLTPGSFSLTKFKDYNSHMATEYDRLNAVNMLRKAEKTGDPNEVARALDRYSAKDAKATATSLRVLSGPIGAGTQMKKISHWMNLQGSSYEVKMAENDLISAEDSYARNPTAASERNLQIAQLNYDGTDLEFQAQMLGLYYKNALGGITIPVDFRNALGYMNYMAGDMQTQAEEIAEEAASQSYYDKYGVWPMNDMDYGGN